MASYDYKLDAVPIMAEDSEGPSEGQGRRTTRQQYAVMLDYMERHGDMSYTFRDGDNVQQKSRVTRAMQWAELTKRLNSMSGYRRSDDAWRKVWSDWKNNTKKKYHKMMSKHKDGNFRLSTLEERLIKLVGNKYVPRKRDQESNPDQSAELDHNNQSGGVQDTTMFPVESTMYGGEEPGDPLLPVKRERQYPPQADKDSDMFHSVSPRSASPPFKPKFTITFEDELPQDTPEEPKLDARSREREEELHRLKMAERVWALKNQREKHAIVQRERKRAQQELEWRELELKTVQEKHAAAQLERERAQHRRDLALLQLQRAHPPSAGALHT